MDQKIAKKFHLKKYGFHGIAVESALKKVEEKIEKIPEKIIFAHLGGGSSVTAVQNGKSLINSMGLTPISGLMMTTRIGNVDSDLDKILAQKIGKPLNVISDLFSRKSGFLGLTGSENIKEIFEKVQSGKDGFEKENLAFDIFLNQVVQKIGAYSALMRGTDLLVFSGGIGEGNSFFRKEILKRIEHLGIDNKKVLAIKVDEEKIIFDKIKDF
jgi:acetate kinase